MKNEGISKKRIQRFRDIKEEQSSYYEIIKIICGFRERQAEESLDIGKVRI
jgi:hypothetical protein